MTVKQNSRLVNKDILENTLGLRQHSRSLIFLKANTLAIPRQYKINIIGLISENRIWIFI